MRYKEENVNSVSDFLQKVRKRTKLAQPIWYRGQENKTWGLSPTIARLSRGISGEPSLVTRFKQNALGLLSERPGSEWEWLFVMRHHGVPTRLLDWSESPLVALYFAVSTKPKSDGAVWSLLPIELNKLANIPLQHPAEIPGFDDHKILNNYLPSSLIQEQQSRLQPAAIAPRNTKRMQAQHGVFTITHRDQTPIEDIDPQKHIWRVTVPARSKARILSELSSLNINRLSLFPELDHVAAHAQELLK